MALNFKLFENFKEAAKQRNLEVKPGTGYYSIRLPNERYIYCWTPLNKMWNLNEYLEDNSIDRALNHLKDNFQDFHLEIDSRIAGERIMECFIEEQSNEHLSVADIVKIIDILNDDKKLDQKRVWTELMFG